MHLPQGVTLRGLQHLLHFLKQPLQSRSIPNVVVVWMRLALRPRALQRVIAA